MAENQSGVNGTIAPLANVARFTELAERLANRHPDMPGFGLFFGKAGLGKTFAATHAINTYRAFYVECDITFTQRAFCQAILVEIGRLTPGSKYQGSVHDAAATIGGFLANHPQRPLIIDEADFLVKHRMIEIVRAIHKQAAAAGSSIILIGEESMPLKLLQWERVHSRVLKAVQATPLDDRDVGILAARVCPGLDMGPDTIAALRHRAAGSARRVVTCLYDLQESARTRGWKSITPANLEEVTD